MITSFFREKTIKRKEYKTVDVKLINESDIKNFLVVFRSIDVLIMKFRQLLSILMIWNFAKEDFYHLIDRKYTT